MPLMPQPPRRCWFCATTDPATPAPPPRAQALLLQLQLLMLMLLLMLLLLMLKSPRQPSPPARLSLPWPCLLHHRCHQLARRGGVRGRVTESS
jgi:hypothetical protein